MFHESALCGKSPLAIIWIQAAIIKMLQERDDNEVRNRAALTGKTN
jgi:hypothetical protein